VEQALSDMKVLDFTQHVAGPYCTKLLADFGADVIKIEKPGEGDSSRRLGPFPGDIPDAEKSGMFVHLNTNKRSVSLNLACDTGRKICLDLVKDVDIVVESFRPGVMASLGLDYATLEKVNPRLVMTSLSNFGQTGPYRDYKASDLVLAGIGGTQSGSGVREKPPLKVAHFVTQFMTSLYATVGIVSAFYTSRWQGGGGQYLDLSMMEMLISYGDSRGPSHVRYQFTGVEEARVPAGGRIISSPPAGAYPCADGYTEWFGMERWRQVSAMLKRPDFLTDPRYNTDIARVENHEEIHAILLEWMMQRTRKQCWEEALAADCICAPCNTTEELYQDPHVSSRGFWAEMDHPALGKVTVPGRPFIFNEGPWQLRRPAPLLGQHTAEVLAGLGYSNEDLVKLSETGVI